MIIRNRTALTPAAALVVCVLLTATIGAPAIAAAAPAVTVAAVGDMCFDGSTKALIRSRGGKAPLAAVASRLNGADVTVGNLEGPLSRRGSAVPGKTYTFRGDPRAVQGLTLAGFDLVALGNNHARDYGSVALRDTFRNLDAAGIGYAGAGADRSAAFKPAIIERNGAKIAYLSFSQIGPADFAATTRSPGTAFTTSLSSVRRAVRAARQQADYVIVSFHWGVEYENRRNSRQVAYGHAAVNAGADMVLSHHPHVIQGVEFYRGKLIAYSLGNFVFSPGKPPGRDSVILHATVGPDGVSEVSMEPVRISGGRPIPQSGRSARRILSIAKSTSTRCGTRVSIEGTRANLTPK